MKNYSLHSEFQKDLFENRVTCVQWVNLHLKAIKEQSKHNAFLEVFTESALAQAKAIDARVAEGTAGSLAGLIVGFKDVFCYKGHKVTAASKILAGFTSEITATCVQKLIDADAIIIGRQNCDEFAMGSSSENSAFGVVKNGADDTRVPGGSSGGSAVAVQLGMCQVSLGTDTGGSVRQPAAFCGIVGMKPTYSRISRYGIVAYASSFDVIGIFSRNIEDNARVLQTIAGQDPMDMTSSKEVVDNYVPQKTTITKKRIAYIKETIEHRGLSERLRTAFINQIRILKELGHEVEAIPFHNLEYLLPVYYILTTAEASSNLSRYDGVRYGYRSPNATDLESLYKKTRTEGFGDEVRKRILLGTYVLSADYYDAYYVKAQKARRVVKEETERILSHYDFIVSPTTPDEAFPIGAKESDSLAMYLEDLFTVQASVAGVPSITVPLQVKKRALPLGFQIIGNMFCEKDVYEFANYVLETQNIKQEV